MRLCAFRLHTFTVTEAVITRLFKRFFNANRMSPNPALMTKKVFLQLPGLLVQRGRANVYACMRVCCVCAYFCCRVCLCLSTHTVVCACAVSEIAANPLKQRLLHVFGFNEPHHRDGINFGTFVQRLSIFTEKSSRMEKIRGVTPNVCMSLSGAAADCQPDCACGARSAASFEMYDLDGTGKITRENLREILDMVVDLGATQTEAQAEQHEAVRLSPCCSPLH